MPYLIKYIKNFDDIKIIKEICNKDIELGYKLIVFSDKNNKTDVYVDNTEFVFCEDARQAAVIKAKDTGAEKCQFYLDIAGIPCVDPNVYPKAQKLKELDYDEALELVVSEHNPLAEKIIATAKRNSVRLEVLSLYDKTATLIKEVLGVGGMEIKSIVKDPNITIFTLTNIPDKKGITYRIFKKLSESDIFVDSIMLPAANDGQQDISFSVKSDDKLKVNQILLDNQAELEYKGIITTSNVAKISVIGSGIQTNYGVAAKFLEVLYQNDINVMMIFTTEIKISVVVEKSKADIAVDKIYKAFIK